MTPAQRTGFYIPLWLEIARAWDWRMEHGRLVADLDAQIAGAHGIIHDALQTIAHKAARLARTAGRPVTADDLRHACNWLASNGRHTSSKKFSQADFNHFARLKNLLTRPDDLAATSAWLNPTEDDRQRSLSYLRKITNEGRLVAISRNAWHSDDWESLDQGKLDWLLGQVKGQPKYGRTATPQSSPGSAKLQKGKSHYKRRLSPDAP